MNNSKIKICSIPYYREDQYEQLRAVSIDKGIFSRPYDDYMEITKSKHKEMERKGFKVVKIIINIEELIEWAKSKHLNINTESRTRFTMKKLKAMMSNGLVDI